MPGVKGKSGGAREGAGRKPAERQTLTLKVGDQFYMTFSDGDGFGSIGIVTVTSLHQRQVKLTSDNGTVYTMVK